MYLDKNAILKALSIEDIIKICNDLGCPDYKTDNHGNLCFSTSICHGGDSPYKLYYYHTPGEDYPNRKYGCFHCYVCGDTYDVVELVIRANRLKGKTFTWYQALRYIGQLTNKLESGIVRNVEKSEETTINDLEWISRLQSVQKKSNAIPNLSEINENILDMFCYIPHEDWLNDNVTREALSRFGIGYYGLSNQIIIPHRDRNGRLIGIRGRFLSEEDIKNIGKYVPLQIEGKILSHSLGSNLYGLDVVKDKVEKCKKIMLVEAEKSCLQAYSYFGDDSFVVAVCGSNITKTQIKIINELQIEEVLVGFDREYHDPHSYEAEVWWQKTIKKVAPLVPYMKVSIVADTLNRLDFKDSPTDKGKEILLELLEEKIPVTIQDIKELKEDMKK